MSFDLEIKNLSEVKIRNDETCDTKQNLLNNIKPQNLSPSTTRSFSTSSTTLLSLSANKSPSLSTNTTPLNPSENATTKNSFTNISLQLKAMKSRLNLNLESRELVARTFIPPTVIIEDVTTPNDTILEKDFDRSPKNPFECFYKHHRDKLIQDELKLTFLNSQDGIHVVPSYTSLQVWFGVIFVKEGPYDEGIFHFSIIFQDSYPETRPLLQFKSKVFHPQIDKTNGKLNLKHIYKQRNYISIWELLRYTRSLFYHIDTNDCYNKEAGYLFLSAFDKFKARCRASVLDSLLAFDEQIYNQSIESENPFLCSILDNTSLQGVKKIMLSMNFEALKESTVMEWARVYLGKLLNNINSAY
ncbi:protein crossbronx [Hydra vulgaris]|uniref:Protein crossbronx n=1 Tax=Hydra vulgaris TaxID=6087 RepID=A0ABM4B612_HYDVU